MMSIDTTLLTLFQELMASYDSSISTAEGSSFYNTVMRPFLTRIGESPLNVDLEPFLIERLTEEHPDLDTSQGSAIRDLVVRPATTMLAPLLREIRQIKLSQSLDNYEQLTRAEVDALLGNFFLSIRDGDKATGIVRLYFSAPQSVTVSPLTEIQSGSGLLYYPTNTQSITSTAMNFNIDGSLYYFDVNVEAAEAGDAYNVTAGSITKISGVSGVVKVDNLADFSAGTDDETKAEAVARAEESITIRNLSTDRGIRVVIPDAFPSLTVIQVIGFGEAEMLRDIVEGPTAISSIPGGFLEAPSVLTGGQQIHIGGKTDVYVFQEEAVSETLDIQNVTDVGVRVLAGVQGYTPSGAPFTTTFRDETAAFSANGVQAGDILRVGSDEHTINNVVSQTQLLLASTMTGGQDGLTYEIIRRTDGEIEIPLYQLVAADSDGNAILDDNGDPVAPLPGSLTREALTDPLSADSNNYVATTENIADANMSLPVVRVSKVTFLNSLTLEEGDELGMRDLLLARASDDFTGGSAGTPAAGTARLYYQDPVSAWVTAAGTSFSEGTYSYTPDSQGTGTASVAGAGQVIKLLGVNLEGTILEGEKIEWSGGTGETYTVVSAANNASDTDVTIREEFAAGDAGSGAYIWHQGISKERMESQTEHGLYYWDVDVTATTNGAGGNISEDTELTTSGENAEGWSLKPTYAVHSFSTRELPFLRLSQWVGGVQAANAVDLEEALTAYTIRVTYDYADDLAAVQDFVDDDDNRVVSEDILVRHFLPAYVMGSFVATSTDTSLDQDTVLEALQAYVLALEPTEGLELSDLIGKLYDEGVTYVQLPMTLVAREQNVDRTWSATISEDSLGSNRVQHFLAPDVTLSLS